MSTTSTGETIVREITIKAPAERIFAALIDPEQVVKWWGTRYITSAKMESELRPGGKWTLRGTAGERPFSIGGEYRTIEPPKRLAFTLIPDWMPGSPETVVRFDLEEHGGTTLVRLTHSGLTKEAAQGFQGWPEIMGALKEHVEGNP